MRSGVRLPTVRHACVDVCVLMTEYVCGRRGVSGVCVGSGHRVVEKRRERERAS